MSRKRVGLALGGGSARGLAHVGVLQVLEREGIPIDCIAGTSAGSVAGATYAAGLGVDRMVELALDLRWGQVARPVWPRRGLVSFAPLEAFLTGLLGDLEFSALRIPFAAVATDLATSRAVGLTEGRVAQAVRASSSIPGLVTPVRIGDRLLGDGGIANNLPIGPVRDLGAEVVIAVDVIVPLGRPPRGIVEMSTVALETLIARAGDDPSLADIYIAVPLHGLRSYGRLGNGARLMAMGREAAERALPGIQEVVG